MLVVPYFNPANQAPGIQTGPRGSYVYVELYS